MDKTTDEPWDHLIFEESDMNVPYPTTRAEREKQRAERGLMDAKSNSIHPKTVSEKLLLQDRKLIEQKALIEIGEANNHVPYPKTKAERDQQAIERGWVTAMPRFHLEIKESEMLIPYPKTEEEREKLKMERGWVDTRPRGMDPKKASEKPLAAGQLTSLKQYLPTIEKNLKTLRSVQAETPEKEIKLQMAIRMGELLKRMAERPPQSKLTAEE